MNRQVDKYINSAGTMTFHQGKVLMIQTRGRRWSFPKGHIEKGENPEAAAVRETKEETGVDVEIIPGFSYVVPSAMPGDQRTVTYFLAKYVGGQCIPQLDEVTNTGWQPIEEARQLIRFPMDAQAYDAAVEAYNNLKNNSTKE